MSDAYESVTVTVPRSGVPELLQFAADLARGDGDRSGSGDGVPGLRLAGPSGERRFSGAAVRRAYHGGVSEFWRPFLALMAEKSMAAEDGYVAWTDLYTGIGLTDRQAAGMLGAAERRCGKNPPYNKAYQDREHWFEMPEEVAQMVLGLRREAAG